MFALLEGSGSFIELYLLWFSWAFALVALLLCLFGARSRGKLRIGLFIAAGLVVAPSVAVLLKGSIESSITAYEDRNLGTVASVLPQSRTYRGVAFPAGTKVFLIKEDQSFYSAELQGTASLMEGVPLKGELHPVLMVTPVRDEDTTWEGTLAERHTFPDDWVCAPGKVTLTSRGNVRVCTLAATRKVGTYDFPAGTEISFVASEGGTTASFPTFPFALPEVDVLLPPDSTMMLDRNNCLWSADSFSSHIRVQGIPLHNGFTVERLAVAVDGPVRCAPVTKLHGAVAGEVRVNNRLYKDDETIDINMSSTNK